jgi:2-phosphoglycerate kinase
LPVGSGAGYIGPTSQYAGYNVALARKEVELATIVDGKKRIPFMRGMLVHHLIQRGFDHDEAYDVADSVRQVVRELGEVDKKDMLKLIAETLQEQYPERPIGDLVFWESRPTTITVERRKGQHPFSKETLSRSLQASGLAPDDAYDIAREIESGLIDKRCSRITHTELQEAAATALTERHGLSYAERYFIVRALKDLDKPLIILIGGTSGVGKTTLAVSLANVLDIPHMVATDDIRQIMRLTLAPELMPAIHVSSYEASEVIDSHDPSMDPVIAGFREQARTVAVGVRAILRRAMEENTSVIIDGVHLLPGILDLSEFEDRAFLAPLCLSISEEEVFEERFQQRAAEAPERSSEKYLSHMTHILKIQDYILENTTRDDIPVIDTTTVEDLTSSAVMVVVERLQDRDEVKKALESAPFSKRLKNRGKKKKKGKG